MTTSKSEKSLTASTDGLVGGKEQPRGGNISYTATLPFAVIVLLMASDLIAQRAFEASGKVFYEDAQRNRTNLGVGFSPVLTHDGRVALLRGRNFGYGEQFDCDKRETKNWVSIYNPATKTERILFDRTVPFEQGKWKFCVFEQMQLSHDGSVLYLVSSVYATSGSLAIINLARGSISYVPGANMVYVIEAGPHRDELIYQRRIWQKSIEDGLEHPGYPLVHAHADGRQILEVSNEHFTVGGSDEVPLLRKYLRTIGGTITVNGRKLP